MKVYVCSFSSQVFQVLLPSMSVTISPKSLTTPRPIYVHHWVYTFQVRLAAAFMRKSLRNFRAKGGEARDSTQNRSK